VLTDNAFGSVCQVPRTLSWFESRLVRLGIAPLHGRPYHPQTQGKAERLNGTLVREMLPRCRTDTDEHFAQDASAFRDLYNHTRPHEALGDAPPVSRLTPSPRKRPPRLPEAQSFYESGAVLRKVSSVGDLRWRKYRILAGRGLVGETVRVEEREGRVEVYYCWKRIRDLSASQLKPDIML
jgi:hypothetical protein